MELLEDDFMPRKVTVAKCEDEHLARATGHVDIGGQHKKGRFKQHGLIVTDKGDLCDQPQDSGRDQHADEHIEQLIVSDVLTKGNLAHAESRTLKRKREDEASHADKNIKEYLDNPCSVLHTNKVPINGGDAKQHGDQPLDDLVAKPAEQNCPAPEGMKIGTDQCQPPVALLRQPAPRPLQPLSSSQLDNNELSMNNSASVPDTKDTQATVVVRPSENMGVGRVSHKSSAAAYLREGVAVKAATRFDLCLVLLLLVYN